MMFLTPLVMVASQPYLWHYPVLRTLQFLFEGLTRSYRSDTSFAVFFFNKLYYSGDLPWYYSAFMTLVTLPETLLLMSFAGLTGVFAIRSAREVTLLFALSGVFILSLGALPGAVLHDINRLMLPALPFVAGLGGCGYFIVCKYLNGMLPRLKAFRTIHRLPEKSAAALLLLALFPAAVDLAAYHPYELSYYNRFIGGLRGAYQRGLEATYFMEAINPEFIAYLNKTFPANAVINGYFTNFMFRYYQREGRLRSDIRISQTESFDYYVFLNRQSTLIRPDPVFGAVRPIYHDSFRFDGVPLIVIYRASR
jgi:hypothetical protein